MNYLGSVSGRQEDKIANSGLTLAFSDDTPYFKEASYVFICKKLFRQPLSSDSLLDGQLDETWYPNGDYHTMYIAEITKVLKAAR
jgi:flavin reductase (DIM6/NTAB) family NADH-FMN oxidoreductase RutF